MTVDISNELNVIKSTQLGRTMRPALHDAIHKQNKELNRSSTLIDEFIKNAQQIAPQNAEIVAARIDNTSNTPVTYANLGKRLDEMKKNNENKVAILNENLEQTNAKLSQIGDVTTFDLAYLGFKFDGSDESHKFQSLIDDTPDKRLAFDFPKGKILKVKNINPNNKTIIIHGNDCTVECGDNDFMFYNDGDTSGGLHIRDLNIQGQSGLVRFESTVNSTQVVVDNIYFKNGKNTNTCFKFKSTDFFNASNINAFDCGIVFDIQSNVTSGERSNTQIHAKNLTIIRCLYGAKLSGCDKVSFIGMDCARCNTGLWINRNVSRATFINFHCENFGNFDNMNDVGDGCAIALVGKANKQIKFQESTIFNTSTNMPNVKYAVYTAPTTENDGFYNQYVFENCYIEELQTGMTLDLNGRFIFNSDFNYSPNQVKLNDNKYNKLCIGEINPRQCRMMSNNILPKTKITSLNDFEILEGAGATVATSGYYTTIDNQNTQNSRLSMITDLEPGWHTFLLNHVLEGARVRIEMRNSPFIALFNQQLYSLQEQNTSIIYFYVETKSVYKIGFDIPGKSSIKIGDFALKRGLCSSF